MKLAPFTKTQIKQPVMATGVSASPAAATAPKIPALPVAKKKKTGLKGAAGAMMKAGLIPKA